MKKEMLINVLQSEECRIAVVEDGVLEELYVERTSQESYVGNVYRGRIVNIEPSIQAAFVDFGIGRNGFLHVSDVDPAYFRHLLKPGERDADSPSSSSGSGGGRGNGRGSRRDQDRGRSSTSSSSSPPMSREPKPVPPPVSEEPTAELLDADDGFGAGLELNGPSTPTPPPQPATESFAPVEPESTSAPMIDDSADLDDFGAGLDFTPPRSSEPPQAVESPTIAETPPQPKIETVTPTEAADLEDDLFDPIADHDLQDDDDFGAGLGLEDLPPPPDEPPAPFALDSVGGTTFDDQDIPIAEPVEEPVEDTEATPKRRRSRSRRNRKPDEATLESDETPPDDAETEPEEEEDTKPKRRRSRRRKPEADAEQAEDPSSDDNPGTRPMDSTERRTTGNEPEIDPPFGGGWGFDDDDDNEDSDADDTTTDDFAWPDDDETTNGGDEPEPAWTSSSTPLPSGFFSAEAVQGFVPGSDTSDFDADHSDQFALGVTAETDAAPENRRNRGRNRDDDDDLVDDDDDAAQGRGGNRRSGRSSGRGDRRGDRRGGGPRGDRGPDAPPIQDIFKRGQEVLVQVIKEPLGTKGPTLSTKISIPGRYLVLAPWMRRIGVSRKIEESSARTRLRGIFNELKPPEGIGFVIRTACADQSKQTLQNELIYLLRLWQIVVRRLKSRSGALEVYRDSDMIIRTIRDIFSDDVDTIWIDERNAYERAKEFLQIVMPAYASRLKFYEGTEPLFHKYGIESEIAKIHQKRVDLPRGGSIVIEQTEALVAIDVNSGNFRSDNGGPEEAAYEMNLHAAREIARQLRLRDLGGVIVNDFIDMKDERHRRNVEKALKDAVERDRARTKVLRISPFGIIEMTRQRIRTSLKRSTHRECPHCHGSGEVKTAESMSIEVMRMLQLAAHRTNVREIVVRVHPEVAHTLLNRKRREIAEFEAADQLLVTIKGEISVGPEFLEMTCLDQHNHEVRFQPLEPVAPTRSTNGRSPSERRRR